MEILRDLLTSRAGLVAAARKILDAAEVDKRDLTGEERQEYDRIDVEVERLCKAIDSRQSDDERRSRLKDHEKHLMAGTARQVPPEPVPRVDHQDGADADYVLQSYGGNVRLRPGTPEFERARPDYTKGFLRYLANPRVDAEALGLQVGTDPKGGYLAPVALVDTLIKFLDDQVFMRQLANVLPPLGSAVSMGAPSWDADPADADWTAEVPAADLAEDDAITLGRRELMPHLSTKLVKFSQKLIRSATIDLVNYVAGRLAYKFGITEEKAFLTGDGAQQPLGVFVASNDGIPTSRDVTTASSTVFTADELIDVLYSMKSGYQQNTTWIFHRDTVKRIRQLKNSATGEYIWTPNLGEAAGARVLGRPYVMSEHAPNTFTAGKYVAIIGDFKAGYWIADSLALEVQRLEELFTLRNQVGLKAAKETDGMPVLAEAFARLKLKP